MSQSIRIHRIALIACALGLSLSRVDAQAPAAPQNLHLYLLVGASNMAGRAEVPADAGEIIDRCYLLNDKNEWEPARNPLNRHSTAGADLAIQKLGPGYSFARKMLEQDKTISIGLIVNAYGNSKIDEWLGKSELYWGARKRAKAAMRSGTIKGILWHQGETDQKAADGYVDKLQTLAGNFRSDLSDTKLPFIAGQIHNSPAINAQIAKLPEVMHASAFVSADGLSASDGTHFDTKSQLLLGERYAEQMIRLQAGLVAAAPADCNS